MFKGQFLLFLIIYIPNSSCVIDAVFDTGKAVWNLYLMLSERNLNHTDNTEKLDLFGNNHITNREIKYKFDTIHEKLNRIEQYMNPKVFDDSLKLLPSKFMIRVGLDKMELFVKKIDESYTTFFQYINESYHHFIGGSQQLEPGSMIPDVDGEIAWIRNTVSETNAFQPDHKNIVDAIADYAVSQSVGLCDGRQIISNILVHLFKIVMLAELKANLMVAMVNNHRYVQNRRGNKLMTSFAIEMFERHLAMYVNIFALNIRRTDSIYLRACDPPIWTQGKNFHELEGTFQTTIWRYHWGVCKYGSCNDIMFNTPNRCERKDDDSRTSCSGTFGGCTYLNAIKACVLMSGPYKFQYVNSTELGPLGRDFECPKNNSYLIEDGSGLDVNYAACACVCYGKRNKINLSIIESRVGRNMVIVGVRFVRKNRILYIQPREGRLDESGYITRYTTNWRPITKNRNESEIRLIDNNNSVFFFDNLRLPPHFVLTGVKFNEVTRSTTTGFAIEIFGVPFDYKSGKLVSESKYRISARAPDEIRGLALMFEPISSMYTRMVHIPDTTGVRYVALERSALSDDFGQSTVPFFDGVPIVTSPPSVLGGIGIFHKGVPSYAGFISLKIFGIRYSDYFSDFQNNHIVDDRVSFNNSNH